MPSTIMRPSLHPCQTVWLILLAWVGPVAPLQAQMPDTAQSLLAQGEALYEQFDNRAALDAFRRAHEQAPDNFDALTWLVRTHVDYAQDLQAEGQKDAAERHYEQAVSFAEDLKEKHPNRPETYFFLASAYGKLAQFKGGRDKVKIGRQVEQYAQRAIELDSTYALPYIALGIFYREVANLNWIQRTFANTFFGGLPGGSHPKAARMLERAVALDPGLNVAHFELALTYEEMDLRRKAIQQLRKVIELPPATTQDRRNQDRARALLDDWTG